MAVGKIQVEQDHGWRFSVECLQSSGKTVYAVDFKVRLALDQAETDQIGVAGIVFNHQHVMLVICHRHCCDSSSRGKRAQSNQKRSIDVTAARKPSKSPGLLT